MTESQNSNQIPLIADDEELFKAVHALFESMKQAMLREPNPSWEVRLSRLQRLEAMIISNRKKIQDAINTDFGARSAFLTDMIDIFPTLTEIRQMKANAGSWMKPQNMLADPAFLPARLKIIPQPKGVVGVISPWNYPLLLSMGPACQAIAAGNRVMVKITKATPVFADLMKTLVSENFEADELSVITGDDRMAEYFSKLPFDHLIFTGSTRVGRKILAAGADNLTPITLELGGKSPVVIAPGYPIRQAAERIMFGKLLNAGQTCIAPDYVLLEESKASEFLLYCRKAAEKFYPRGIADEDYASIISAPRLDKLLSQLKSAASDGKVESLFTGDQFNVPSRKLGPQLIFNLPLEHELLQEEIFGPILPVLFYPDGNPDAALNYIASKPHPLAAYWFDQDRKRIQKVLNNLVAGGITINDTLWQITQSKLPFGGIGESGLGRYMGKAGFETFSHLKPVFIQSSMSQVDKVNPPYSAQVREWVDKLIQDPNVLKWGWERAEEKWGELKEKFKKKTQKNR